MFSVETARALIWAADEALRSMEYIDRWSAADRARMDALNREVTRGTHLVRAIQAPEAYAEGYDSGLRGWGTAWCPDRYPMLSVPWNAWRAGNIDAHRETTRLNEEAARCPARSNHA